MSKITIEQKQAELESNESMVMEYLALFNNGDHIVERKGNRFLIANQNLFASYILEVENRHITAILPNGYHKKQDRIKELKSQHYGETDFLNKINDFEEKWDIFYTSTDEIKSAIYENYIASPEKLNLDQFSIPVKASKATLLKTYAEIQKAINGDYVVRLHDAIISCSDVTGHPELYVTGIEEDLSSCKDANEIFKGEYNEFLRRYKYKESDTNIYRLTDISYDENGSITGIQRDFIPRLDQVL